jgi:hypothetical protein
MTRRLPRHLLSYALAVPATLRLTRFITSDWLGEWLVDKPLRKWAVNKSMEGQITMMDPSLTEDQIFAGLNWSEDQPWRVKLVKGLDCPFCVGFWIGLVILAAAAFTPKILRPALHLLFSGLALNYLVGHVSSRID